ncbi:alpha/beta fold hydrolase [Chitinimonas sp.]|uniref:alpha/beta fold hydrolase n=1 Tax=Chitinimonas sp. TaxID=1934313 RepID=UPI0035B1B83D
MSEPRQSQVLVGRQCGVYRMAYREWGDPANPRVLICAHGLGRNGRDFAQLADSLSAEFRVVAPDVVGRGASEWLRDPMGYQIPMYVQDMLVLIARLQPASLSWVGTSMGGLIGMVLAALPGTPIERLVLNDIGPNLERVALARIAEYVGKAPRFPSREAAEAYVRLVSAPFGPHSDAQWAYLTDVVLMADGDGWRLNYDPGIGVPFRQLAEMPEIGDFWPFYDRIACPTLVTRGALSDLLTVETACAMSERGPRARWVDFDGVGHAPTFLHADQIAVVSDFLLGA